MNGKHLLLHALLGTIMSANSFGSLGMTFEELVKKYGNKSILGSASLIKDKNDLQFTCIVTEKTDYLIYFVNEKSEYIKYINKTEKPFSAEDITRILNEQNDKFSINLKEYEEADGEEVTYINPNIENIQGFLRNNGFTFVVCSKTMHTELNETFSLKH
jgi:hypothetical protein